MLIVMNIYVSVYIITDSKSKFDTITASKRLCELHLLNDMADIHRAYPVKEINISAWVRSSENDYGNLTCHVGNDIPPNAIRTERLSFIINSESS